MAWDSAAFETACKRFWEHFPDFKNFEVPGKKYRWEERDYKDELVDLYRKEVEPLVSGDPEPFLDAYVGILRRKLKATGKSQNLVGWRALRNLDGPDVDRAAVGKAMQAVVSEMDSGETGWKETVDAYGRVANLQLNNPWGVRQLIAVLLLLHRPESQISLTMSAWNGASMMLVATWLLKSGSVVDGAEMSRCLAFAAQVKRALDAAGWRTRDMIDVQSFLWVIAQKSEDPEPPILEVVGEHIEAQGMRIDDRTLRRYHYALQSRGFVILAGPSGTGKTWLTKLYADAVHARYTLAPVAPNWAANEDLLGYFNPFDRKFHPTAFLEFIDEAAEAWKERGKDAADFHLVLDEMNLARVEHYFSLFLSLMEMRSGDLVPQATLAGGRLVQVPPNLKFAGTVNMDETTHGFSDKVFDRAQLIELSVSRPAVEAHIADVPYAKHLLELWDAMSDSSPFGFRVIDDIAAYIELAGQDGVAWKLALDDQIVSKLLPKLRGIEPEAGKALEQVSALVRGRFRLAAAKCEAMLSRYRANDVVTYF